jgi:Sigma 54 modulation/S30EA ribosomal protein C terminus
MDSPAAAVVPVEVQVSGPHSADIVHYAQDRIRTILQHTDAPALHARVRITHHADPAVELPVTAQANLDVNGRFVRARARARTDEEAVDLLLDRLRHRLQHDHARSVGSWEDRRGQSAPTIPQGGEQHEWRHSDAPAHLVPYFPRPVEERRIIRHKSYTVSPCGIDEAAFDMEALDHDVILFTEIGSDQDSVLYQAGPTGYRLAQVLPDPDQLARHTLPVTVSGQPAPLLDTDEAIQRMASLDHPFLFYLDGERGRGALLYHRYDGHYGLITPADTG